MKNATLLLAVSLACQTAFAQTSNDWIWYTPPLLNGAPSDLQADGAGNFWVSEESTLFRFDGAIWESIDVADSGLSLTNDYINEFEVVGSNEVWISVYDRMLKYDLNNETWEEHDPTGPNWSAQGTGIAIDSENHIWWSCFSGLYEYDGIEWIEHNLDNGNPPPYPYYFSQLLYDDVLIDHEDNKWVLTTDYILTEPILDIEILSNTLIKFDGTQITTYVPGAGLIPFSSFHLVIDADGKPILIPLGFSLAYDNEYQVYENGSWSDPFEIPYSGYICDAWTTSDNKLYLAFGNFIAVGDLNGSTWETIEVDGDVISFIDKITVDEEKGILIAGYWPWENEIGFYPFFKYRAKGRVYVDQNENGNFDAGDLMFKDRIVQTTDGQNVTFSKIEGNYTLVFPDPGSYALETILPPQFSYGTPASGQQNVTLTPQDSVVTGIDFGLIPDTSGVDLAVSITPSGGAVPGQVVTYFIQYQNLTAKFTDLQIDFHFDSLLTFQNASPAPAIQNGNDLTFLPGPIGGLEEEGIWLHFTLPPNGNLIGEVLTLEATVTPLNNSEFDLSNNTYSLDHEITGPLDPNFISVVPEGIGPNGEIFNTTPFLEYTIHFQNVGNDTAFNVIISNPIEEDLNLLSLQVLAASHDYQIDFDNGQHLIHWGFEDIDLVDSLTNETESHGFIKYILAPVSQEVGLTLTNQADIFFDYNAPIATNTVVNTLVDPAYQTFLEAGICPGESYLFAGDTLTSAGVWYNTLTSTDGYDSLIVLTLTVYPIYETQLVAGVCDGSSYDFNGLILTETGIYSDTLPTTNGCDSVVVMNFTSDTNFFYHDTLQWIYCPGDTIVFNTQGITAPGTYVDTMLSITGCDSIITLIIAEGLVDTTYLNVQFCEGESLEWNGETFTTCGIYWATLESSNGCDSIVILDICFYPLYYTEETEEICQGDSLIYHGQLLWESGIYYDTMQTIHGCDSIFAFYLTVYPLYEAIQEAEICEGDAYEWGGAYLNTAGTYYDTLISHFGCDSIAILDLDVLPSYETQVDKWFCEEDSILFQGQYYTQTGFYTDSLTSLQGCDSVIHLNLQSDTVFTTIFEAFFHTGEYYEWNGSQYDSAGVYEVYFTSETGCDSIVYLELTECQETTGSLHVQICAGDTIEWQGMMYDTCGIYSLSFQSFSGCDSILVLELECLPKADTSINASFCNGSAFSFNEQQLIAPGLYTDTLTSHYGCDSIIYLTLFDDTPYANITEAEICSGTTLEFNGQVYDEEGIYMETLSSSSGCDSTIFLVLTEKAAYQESQTAYFCPGDTLVWNGQTLTAPGAYADTLQAITGCDSVLILELIQGQTYQTALNADICEGESYEFNGMVLDEPGMYFTTLQTIWGCDSIVMLDLGIHAHTDMQFDQQICAGDSIAFNGNFYSDPGTYSGTLQSVWGCDSIVMLNLEVNPIFETLLTHQMCAGESLEFNGTILQEPGTYSHTLQSVWGCDSTITLDLEVYPAYDLQFDLGICSGDSVTFGNMVLQESGTYSDTLQTAWGCDSIVTLDLEVYPTYEMQYDQQICSGDTVEFNGTVLMAPGTYTFALISWQGCDSLLTLHLDVKPHYGTILEADICFGESIYFNGTPLTEPGSYVDTLTSFFGCDSVMSLELTVYPVYETQLETEIQEGESYAFGGELLTLEGTYFDSLLTTEGCDSVVVLTLMVIPPSNTFETSITGNCEFSVSSIGNIIELKFPSNDQYTLIIYDINGKRIRTISSDQQTVNISSEALPAGYYILMVKGRNCPRPEARLILLMN